MRRTSGVSDCAKLAIKAIASGKLPSTFSSSSICGSSFGLSDIVTNVKRAAGKSKGIKGATNGRVQAVSKGRSEPRIVTNNVKVLIAANRANMSSIVFRCLDSLPRSFRSCQEQEQFDELKK